MHRKLGVRVVVDVDLTDVRLLLFPVQLLDLMLLAAVHVDRLLVEVDRRGVAIHLADHARRAGDRRIHDHEVVGGSRAQADRLGREALAGPVPLAAGAVVVERALILEVAQEFVGGGAAEALAGLERQLERRATQMIGRGSPDWPG